ncbi:MAG: M14 family zinc carboxypeptidase [Owenweeksia sp.]|nr:M14 family zinc carboxypeptidase [Owenweeksia sp.]
MHLDFKEEDYGLYLEHDFRHRWLRPAHLQEKLEKYRQHSSFTIKSIGESPEGRAIKTIKWGQGKQRVLLWSQMHGNEPTATMALIDVLNFLMAQDDYQQIRQKWHDQLELLIMPMLNPDGAERFTRANALGVDLNRDAVPGEMPEMKIFQKQLRKFQPHWTFNLHDQRSIFAAGPTAHPATISFLSAASDHQPQEHSHPAEKHAAHKPIGRRSAEASTESGGPIQ